MSTRFVRIPVAGIIAAVATAIAIGPLSAQNAPRQRWIATWAASAQNAPPRPSVDSIDRVPTIAGRTIREIVRVSIGGTQVRIRLSNEYGDRPLVIGSAHIALRSDGVGIDASSDRTLTFSGQSSVVIRQGANMVSDAVPLNIAALADVAVTLYIVDSARLASRHALALQTNYVSGSGDFSGAPRFTPDTTLRMWPFLTGVDVMNPAATGVIVAFGNSITDGAGSKADANHRWPDVLAGRLHASKEPKKAVVNSGISGNRVLTSGTGPSALQRFDRDVLMQPGVTHVIVLEGINDIGRPAAVNSRDDISAAELIAGHQQLVDRAHERGLVIFGATLTPVGGMGGLTPELVAKVTAFNTWMRTSGAYDGVIDFDKAIRDPSDTTRMLPAYDSGDHLHPSDAGYKAMGEFIDLAIFRPRKK